MRDLEDLARITVDASYRLHRDLGPGLLVDIRSVDRLLPVHAKQVLTYLRVMQLSLGLLINFGGETLKEGLKRIVNRHDDTPWRLGAFARNNTHA